jgi:hypothetical protein
MSIAREMRELTDERVKNNMYHKKQAKDFVDTYILPLIKSKATQGDHLSTNDNEYSYTYPPLSICQNTLDNEYLICPSNIVDLVKKQLEEYGFNVRAYNNIFNISWEHIKIEKTLKLYKNKHGNFEDEPTHFIFDKETEMVIGYQEKNGDIRKLTDEEIKTCFEKRFRFDLNQEKYKTGDETDEDEIDDEALEELRAKLRNKLEEVVMKCPYNTPHGVVDWWGPSLKDEIFPREMFKNRSTLINSFVETCLIVYATSIINDNDNNLISSFGVTKKLETLWNHPKSVPSRILWQLVKQVDQDPDISVDILIDIISNTALIKQLKDK